MSTLVAALFVAVASAANPAPAEHPALPAGAIAVVLGFRVTEAERDELDSIVLWALLSEFTREHNLAPTAAEFDAAVRHTMGATEDELAALIAERDGITARIRFLTGAAHSELETERGKLAALETRIQNLLGARNGNPMNDRGQSTERSARLNAAQWKVDQAIFERFGGRVAITPSGHEPIDAYRAFLKEQEAAGAFRFADEATRDAFWAEWNDDSARRWLSDDEAKSYFDEPWWLVEAPAE